MKRNYLLLGDPADFEGLNHLEVFAVMNLLHWDLLEGSLPADDISLSFLNRISITEWKKIKSNVLERVKKLKTEMDRRYEQYGQLYDRAQAESEG